MDSEQGRDDRSPSASPEEAIACSTSTSTGDVHVDMISRKHSPDRGDEVPLSINGCDSRRFSE